MNEKVVKMAEDECKAFFQSLDKLEALLMLQGCTGIVMSKENLEDLKIKVTGDLEMAEIRLLAYGLIRERLVNLLKRVEELTQ